MKTHLVAGAAVLLASAAWADSRPKPNMDIALGLWEMTAKGDFSGAPPIPDSVLARLTPEQQPKLQEMLAGRSQPKKYKSCMTPGKLGEGFESDTGGQATGQCTSTVAINTQYGVPG
jgi:hypothetical protein